MKVLFLGPVPNQLCGKVPFVAGVLLEAACSRNAVISKRCTSIYVVYFAHKEHIYV